MRFYGQWFPPVDAVLFHNFFPDIDKGGVLVECGAGDGLTESCGKLFEEHGWKCFNIEPDTERFSALCSNRPDSVNIRLALSNQDSDDSLEFIRGPLSHQTTQAPCRTWNSFVLNESIDHVDLFVLDVEGHELKVIEGMAGTKVLPRVICAEYPWPTTQLAPLTAALEPMGYHLWFASFNNAYYSLDPRPDGKCYGETRIYNPGELG